MSKTPQISCLISARSGNDPARPGTPTLDKNAPVTVIFGKRGSGKTTLSKILSKRYDRVIILDPMEEYKKDTIQCETIVDIIDYVRHNKKFRLSLVDDKQSEYLFELAWVIQDLCLIIEEVDIICQPSFIGEKFGDCVKRGRHRNIELIASSRRPAEVNRLLTSQATDSYVFMISEPADIKYIEKFTCAEIRVRMGELEKFDFWYHNPENNLPRKGYIKDFSEIIFDN